MTSVLGPMEPADVPILARLHVDAFPGFFLSTLGEPFLVQMYCGFLSDPSAVCVVAHDADGEVLGAVVGTVQPVGFFSRLLKRRWPGFALASARAVIRNPAAAPRLLAAIRYRGGPRAAGEGALLSSICVDRAARGTGVGRELITMWERLVADRGVHAASLTTDADNNSAVNGFYQSQGWELANTYLTNGGRSMNLYTKKLGRQ